MPPLIVAGQRVHIPQWASLEAVTPLARIAVAPEDFPFLAEIRGHDDAYILERAKSDPDGFPLARLSATRHCPCGLHLLSGAHVKTR